MQNHPQLLLLRRPLPPKLPKLPVDKKVRPATTDKTEIPLAKFTQGERDKTSFPDTVSREPFQTSIGVQNLSLDDRVQKRATPVPGPPKPKLDRWRVPDTATGCVFFPSCPSASTRVFGKRAKQWKRSRKPKGEPSKIKKTSVDDMLKDILIFSSTFSKPIIAPPPVTPTTPEDIRLMELPVAKSRAYTFKHPLIDMSVIRPIPLPRIMPVQAQSRWFGHLQPSTAVLLDITHFPGVLSIPPPVLPRKPRRQSEIETRRIEAENLFTEDVQSSLVLHEGLTKSRRPNEAETQVKRREVHKTVVTTQYDTIQAMTNLAVVNCQVHGRNALNLQGFFILNCPDLTCLALQLVYLNLSFNDISSFPTEIFCLKYLQILILRNNPIKAIPSEIQQLQFLRVFNIAFNLILNLPPGLFYLPYLEELNISYNSIAAIPNEIQKLRSLRQLLVDGNDLTSFPPGILKLRLKKIQFDNNFTHPYLWRENSLNSPQSLTQVASLAFLKHDLDKYYDVIPEKIQLLLKGASKCEWCEGPRFGEGYRVIQSCNVFGVARLPVMFRVCSSSCYRAVNKKSVF
ncbi:leucine-rich repeat-containing protein 63 [Artibeus jamaicensis]|uniref:leucine-rich repeat-containing protein 63 n=1 Tax=Artibeus jamaicensis TaxID=9417 RepID=UPI00235A5B82|nr:leucine-rich repeat-containing protein 63 [Artibeus jamaicensis]